MGETMRWADGFIAVDWGTTNRRAYLIDTGGKCTQEFEDDQGVLAVGAGGFAKAVADIRGRLGDKPLLLAGMVGSNRGWVETPYVPAPAAIDQLAAAICWAGEREAIVPGVSYVAAGRADVMRGEEVQLLGAIAAGLVDPDALICHPGTHAKWVLARSGGIKSFRTVMTGELFNLLRQYSILSDLLAGKVELNDAFKAGACHGVHNSDLPAELFAVRARVLLQQARPEDAASYASGLLIGNDVRIGLSEPLAAGVVVMGRPELTRLYAAAVEQAGRTAVEVDGDRSFVAGIARIAERI